MKKKMDEKQIGYREGIRDTLAVLALLFTSTITLIIWAMG